MARRCRRRCATSLRTTQTPLQLSPRRHAADDGHYHGYDAPRDPALRYDLASKHEKRHREQRKVIETPEHIGLDGLGWYVRDGQHRDDRGHEQNKEDRKPNDQQDQRLRTKSETRCFVTPYRATMES